MSRQEIKEILHNLDVRADILDKEALSKTLSILINLVERLSEQNEELKIENQKLRDENNSVLSVSLHRRKKVNFFRGGAAAVMPCCGEHGIYTSRGLINLVRVWAA